MSVTPPPLPPVSPAGVDDQNPWPGLSAFTENASDYFFGRSEEIAEVFRRIKREAATVLYGHSGLGKTSMLQAGLFPVLRQAGFLPIYIRLDFSPSADPLVQQVRGALTAALDAAQIDAPRPGEETLWE
jgi:hypothetical protein